MRWIFSMIVLVLLAACKAPPPVVDPLAIAPGDFSLDVTVVTSEPHTLAHMRSSRYVVFPDGSLHHGDEDGWGPNTLPVKTRHLTREQIAMVWNRLDQMGMANDARADETVNFQLLEKPSDGSLYMIAVTAKGKYWNYIRYIGQQDPADPAFEYIIRLLAGYAWATDLPGVEVYEEPNRYDLGPDPYEKYRGEVEE
ncbi:MAG: hypothetical protein HOC93_04830 [Phycisphaerae bacterium]|jgi:hypothetical protein|nr:hypothetical protein [Phycisphaerae bacterium]|tara:strand:+ start:6416 stop:7003 length:588 start_codon:yes stop_codon:yes gene_type:complete